MVVLAVLVTIATLLVSHTRNAPPMLRQNSSTCGSTSSPSEVAKVQAYPVQSQRFRSPATPGPGCSQGTIVVELR